tara:strand:+ start:944 stop:1222 length:279 start_codon:yes stop_codon:yes gene_type:complete
MCGARKTTINNQVEEKDVMPAIDMKVADLLIGSSTPRSAAKVSKGVRQLDFTEVSKKNQNNLNIKPVSHDIGYIADEQMKKMKNNNSLQIGM